MHDRFSPGPWSADESGVIRNSSGWAIAYVHSDDETGRHNSKLAAASPQLLAKTRSLLRRLQQEIERHDVGCDCIVCDEIHDLRVLVAEATGDSRPAKREEGTGDG